MSLRLFVLVWCFSAVVSGQNTEAGRALFEGQCATCHGADARGGELGPAIVMRIPQHSDEELATLIHQGLPNRGMPGSTLGSQQTGELIAFLRSLRAQRRPPAPPVRLKVALGGSRTLEGLVFNQSSEDMQLLTDDLRIHLLRKDGAGLPRGHQPVRLANLSRPVQRESLHRAGPDLEKQCGAAGAEVDLLTGQHRPTRSARLSSSTASCM